MGIFSKLFSVPDKIKDDCAVEIINALLPVIDNWHRHFNYSEWQWDYFEEKNINGEDYLLLQIEKSEDNTIPTSFKSRYRSFICSDDVILSLFLFIGFFCDRRNFGRDIDSVFEVFRFIIYSFFGEQILEIYLDRVQSKDFSNCRNSEKEGHAVMTYVFSQMYKEDKNNKDKLINSFPSVSDFFKKQ